MPRNNNHHGEATGPGKRKTEIETIAGANGGKLTPIERIFLEVMGREMLPEERELLLKPKFPHAKSSS